MFRYSWRICALRIALFEPEREHRLAHLALERARRRQTHGSRELLRDRAAALDDSPRAEVAQRRADDADRVEAVMRIEAPILDREERVDHVRRHLVERDVDPLLGEEGKGRLALAIEDDRRLGARREVGQVVGAVELAWPRRA